MTKYYCEVLFYPLPSDGQVCLSREPNSSRVSLVVDDEQLGESLQQVKKQARPPQYSARHLKRSRAKLPIWIFSHLTALVFSTIDIANLWNRFNINIVMGEFGCTHILLSRVTFSAKKWGYRRGCGDFWLKCSPSIADRSLKVSRVSPHRKNLPHAETEANMCQNRQDLEKSAIRVMWILRGRAKTC